MDSASRSFQLRDFVCLTAGGMLAGGSAWPLTTLIGWTTADESVINITRLVFCVLATIGGMFLGWSDLLGLARRRSVGLPHANASVWGQLLRTLIAVVLLLFLLWLLTLVFLNSQGWIRVPPKESTDMHRVGGRTLA